MLSFKKKALSLFKIAGIEVNGSKPWDIQVYNENFYERTLKYGSLGFGESYMDGWWSVEQLDVFLAKVFDADLENKIKPITMLPYLLKANFVNIQKGKRAFEVGQVHYDVGNDLYSKMLDRRMTYTCAYWDEYGNLAKADTLDAAQENKLDMICQKLDLKAGDKVLDIGCGWGSFMRYAAEKYGVNCVGISVSNEQVKRGNETKGDLPIEFRLQDYRDIHETFDHIVSIGMFEHVGYKNYRTYMKIVEKNLKDSGLFLLHTIGTNVSAKITDPWIHKYIFPNSVLPSAVQISKAVEKLFVIEDWHNFGIQYDRTLMTWYDNFKKAWPRLKDTYDERFYKMWEFYLLSSAATFRTRQSQVWQIVLSKHGKHNGYKRICQ